MRTLEFEVSKQRIRKKPNCDFSHIVAGTVGYLHAVFTFSEEWEGCKKAVSFWLDDKEFPVALDEDNSCVIPAEVLGGESFLVSVTGARGRKYIIKTGTYKVRQEVI